MTDWEAQQVAVQRQRMPMAVHYPMTLNRRPALVSRSRCVGELAWEIAPAERMVNLPVHPYRSAIGEERVMAVKEAD